MKGGDVGDPRQRFWTISMGDLQDPKMKVLYHMFGHIFWGYSLIYIGLKNRPYIWNRYLQ